MHLKIKLAHILDIDISLPERGVIAITGPSGAGKTSLLRVVAGLESASRGKVEINGEIWQDDEQNIFLATHRRSIGFVFQEASLFPHLSVQKNIEFGLRRIPVGNKKLSLRHAVELLGIASLLSRNPATLSGGEKQRVSIARALATSPKIVLMDEPLASLDEQRKAEILPYLERLHQELEIPILYVSHARDEVVRLADYVVRLEGGRVCASGNVADLFSNEAQISAQIIAQDAPRQLTLVEFAGGQLWLPFISASIGATVKLYIQVS